MPSDRLVIRKLSFCENGPLNFIAGARVTPIDTIGETKVFEPATRSLLCKVPCSSLKDIDFAVSSAKESFLIWSQFSNTERGRLLTAVSNKIRYHLEDIARLEVKNNGKPIWEARLDIESCADAFEYFGGIIMALTGQHIPLRNDSFALVCREPLGVIAGIGAWNFPMQTTWKAAPALACGNTMVYKPSQLTPITAVVLAELICDVGIPHGVFNVIQGASTTGSLLCEHPQVAKLSFTGSLPTGTKVMSSAATNIKKVTLELGGKSPLIVFQDANMKNAIKATLMGNFLSQGEVCSNGTRVFVHKNIASEFLDKLVVATKKLRIGNPMDETTTVGATISKEHAERVLDYISGAKEEGAVIEYGGERVILPPPLDQGYYLSPCVLSNCRDDMLVVREEVFGAVISFLTFSSEDEVIRRANDTPFGLAGAVFTKDLQRAFRVVRRLEAGTLWINTYNIYPPTLPFGGYKQSGLGRENGTAVLEYYTQLKTIYVETGDIDCGPLYED
uniref:Aldehyde dehydrogenase domain-containing protein n=1 Tax=Timema douglasi TaxID=61478 RepID=A0A7R8VP39_TIMDO|nr:unnamed protein product [Timema douglasi]